MARDGSRHNIRQLSVLPCRSTLVLLCSFPLREVVVSESVSVVGDTRLVDTRTSQITTNFTQEQMRYLPQNSRNFPVVRNTGLPIPDSQLAPYD